MGPYDGASGFKGILLEFGQRSTIHGLNIWSEPARKPLHRILFFIVWLAFFSYCHYLMYNNVKRYLEYNVKVSIIKADVEEAVFPSITICPTHTWRRSHFGGDLYSINFYASQPELAEGCYDPNIPFVNASDPEWWDYGLRLRDGFDFLFIRFQDFFLSCSFLGEKFDCGELFFGHVTNIGRCFTFNYAGDYKSTNRSLVWIYDKMVKKGMKVSRPGWENSLRVQLNLKMDEYCMGEQDEKMGFRISVHDPAILPPFLDDSLLISPGWSSEIGITATRIDKTKVENLGRCEKDKFLSLFPRLNYTQDNCLLQCLAEVAFQECGCLYRYCPLDQDVMGEVLSTAYPDVVGANVAFGMDVYLPCFINPQCEKEITEKYRLGKGNIAEKCRNSCPSACDQTFYHSKMSATPFINERNEEKLKKLTGYSKLEELEKNVAEVSMYFEKMTIQNIVESWDFDYNDLISNMGGTIGLFLGASLFSIVEFLDFLWTLIICTLCTKKTVCPAPKKPIEPVFPCKITEIPSIPRIAYS